MYLSTLNITLITVTCLVLVAGNPSVLEVLKNFARTRSLTAEDKKVLANAKHDELPRAVGKILVPTKPG